MIIYMPQTLGLIYHENPELFSLIQPRLVECKNKEKQLQYFKLNQST